MNYFDREISSLPPGRATFLKGRLTCYNKDNPKNLMKTLRDIKNNFEAVKDNYSYTNLDAYMTANAWQDLVRLWFKYGTVTPKEE